jgi:hypothetical protein
MQRVKSEAMNGVMDRVQCAIAASRQAVTKAKRIRAGLRTTTRQTGKQLRETKGLLAGIGAVLNHFAVPSSVAPQAGEGPTAARSEELA